MNLRTALITLSLSGLCFAEPVSQVPAPDPLPDNGVFDYDVEDSVDTGFSVSLNNRDSLPYWTIFTPEDALTQMEDQIRKGKAAIELICQIEEKDMSYQNVFGALAQIDSQIEGSVMMLVNLGYLMDSPEVREAREKVNKMSTDYGAWVSSNKALWKTIQTAAKQPWVKELSPAKQRSIQQSLDGYIDSGVNLPAEQKAQLDKLVADLSQLSQTFGKNVLDGDNAAAFVITDESQLTGLSDSWKAQAAKKALEKGLGTEEKPQWLVTTDYSAYIDLMKNCDVENTRRLAWTASENVGTTAPYDNAGVVYKILEKRQQMAELLGYKTYVDLAAAHRMIGNCDNVRSFVDGMMEKVKPAWTAEMQDFMDFISKTKGEKYEVLNPWDIAYYMGKLSEERYSFDEEQLRPYLEFDRVLSVMFKTLDELYGITVTERGTQCPTDEEAIDTELVNVWHPEVRFFEIHDTKTGELLGQFYLDPFPRNTKKGGAWVLPLRQSGAGEGPQLGVLALNNTPAVGDKPSLLNFREVVTTYHEYGHMLHAMLTKAELQSHAGTSVAWDFVEMPSQYNEHFAWEKDILKKYAKHYQTGETIPDALLDKFLSSRYFMPARDNMAQLNLAKLDMEMHSRFGELFKGKDIDDASAETLKEWTWPMSVQRQSIMRYLTHCMSGGYSGAYYSYKWAEVLAADGYTRMKKEGIDNKETGASFRKEILEVGDSIPAADAYRNFMGREPNSDALLEEEGLLKK